ncbi:MAG: ATP synthase subunit C [Cenarchaeum symbiont of Oopsacas minuta]|nr:ATP synthase subunit C [Cenarchaeum symbiont of Oopsacas minuta]
MRTLLLVFIATTVLASFAFTGVASAQESSSSSDGEKFLSAGLAFGLAALGAGIGLAYVGSAGLAVISENPALQSKVFIFVGMVESIAIYGIVMMFILLGQ